MRQIQAYQPTPSQQLSFHMNQSRAERFAVWREGYRSRCGARFVTKHLTELGGGGGDNTSRG